MTNLPILWGREASRSSAVATSTAARVTWSACAFGPPAVGGMVASPHPAIQRWLPVGLWSQWNRLSNL